MDLSKAFDSLPHDLIVKKFKEYGADERTANIIEDYFSDRQQRVKVAGEYSSWNYIFRGIAQGSILGPLIFDFLCLGNTFKRNKSVRKVMKDIF